jgi:hypothetical protein
VDDALLQKTCIDVTVHGPTDGRGTETITVSEYDYRWHLLLPPGDTTIRVPAPCRQRASSNARTLAAGRHTLSQIKTDRPRANDSLLSSLSSTLRRHVHSGESLSTFAKVSEKRW